MTYALQRIMPELLLDFKLHLSVQSNRTCDNYPQLFTRVNLVMFSVNNVEEKVVEGTVLMRRLIM